jgi:transposase
MPILRGITFRADPTEHQAGAMTDMANARRLAWNAALNLLDEIYSLDDDGADEALTEDLVAIGKYPWRYLDQISLVPITAALRYSGQLGQPDRVSSSLADEAVVDALRSHKRWVDYLVKRASDKTVRKVGKPQFIPAVKNTPTFRVRRGVKVEKDAISMPLLGNVRVCGSTRHVEKLLKRHKGRICLATVKQERGHWYISLTIEREQKSPDRIASVADLDMTTDTGILAYEKRPDVAGGDLGLTTLLTISDGIEIPNQRFMERSQAHIRHISKAISRAEEDRRLAAWRLAVAHNPVKWPKEAEIVVRCPTTGSGLPMPPAYWLGQVERSEGLRVLYRKLSAAQRKIAAQRDAYYSVIAVQVAKRYAVFGLETLRITNMMANSHLARAIGDAGWGILIRKIESAIEDRGGILIRHDAFYPSTQICSGTLPDGSKCEGRMKLALSVRTYECPFCEQVIGRDLNAAVNLRPTRDQAAKAIADRDAKRAKAEKRKEKVSERAAKAAATNKQRRDEKLLRAAQRSAAASAAALTPTSIAGSREPASVEPMPGETQHWSGEPGARRESHIDSNADGISPSRCSGDGRRPTPPPRYPDALPPWQKFPPSAPPIAGSS